MKRNDSERKSYQHEIIERNIESQYNDKKESHRRKKIQII